MCSTAFLSLLAELLYNYLTDVHKTHWKGGTWAWKKLLDFGGIQYHVSVTVGARSYLQQWVRVRWNQVIPPNTGYVLPSVCSIVIKGDWWALSAVWAVMSSILVM